jgi:hypothetical protein
MSSDELKLAQGLLQDLYNEIDRLDEQIDQMLTEMEGIPEERRSMGFVHNALPRPASRSASHR